MKKCYQRLESMHMNQNSLYHIWQGIIVICIVLSLLLRFFISTFKCWSLLKMGTISIRNMMAEMGQGFLYGHSIHQNNSLFSVFYQTYQRRPWKAASSVNILIDLARTLELILQDYNFHGMIISKIYCVSRKLNVAKILHYKAEEAG